MVDGRGEGVITGVDDREICNNEYNIIGSDYEVRNIPPPKKKKNAAVLLLWIDTGNNTNNNNNYYYYYYYYY